MSVLTTITPDFVMARLDPRLSGLAKSLRNSREIPAKVVMPGLGPCIHAYGIDACVGRSHVDTRIKSTAVRFNFGGQGARC